MNHDPIAELLTIIRNGQSSMKYQVTVSYSKVKQSILDVLKREGYITGYNVYEVRKGIKRFDIQLSYYDGKPVIAHIQRVSKCSRPVYSAFDELPRLYSGMGTLIISTSKGVMSDAELRKYCRSKSTKIGGEIIAEVA